MFPLQLCRLLALVLILDGVVGFVVTLVPLRSSESMLGRQCEHTCGVGLRHTSAVSRCRRAGCSKMGLADAVPGPMKNLFTRKPAPQARRQEELAMMRLGLNRPFSFVITHEGSVPHRARTEGAELYRTLGVTPDADYLEVLEACDRLKEKYKGDRKQIIKLDKAKDDIMALRLTQAVQGNLKTTDEAKSMDRYNKAKEQYIKKKNSPLRVPTWAKGWFEVPDRTYASQVAYRHGAFGILSVVLPSAITGLTFFGGVTSAANMMNRNAPDLKRDENNQIAEIRLPARKTVALTMITVALSYFTGALAGTFACRLIGDYYVLLESWKALFVQFSFALTSLFISTWRDPENGPKFAKRRGMGGRRD